MCINMAAPASSSEPLLCKRKGAYIIDGVHTDILYHEFDDKLFIVITQFEKLGTLVLVNRDMVMDERRGELIYSTNVLLGKDEPEHHVIARGLACKVTTDKPILFSLGLKDTSPRMLKELCRIIEDLIVDKDKAS